MATSTIDQNGSQPSKVAVIVVPLPAQGHLNQLLQLSRIIANHNIPVHHVSTPTHTHQATRRNHGWDPRAASNNIHFHEFSIPEFVTPSINPNAVNKFPSHLMPLFAAISNLRQPIAALIHSLSKTNNRVIVIHDSLMSSVVRDVGSVQNAESYIFHSVSAFSVFLYFCEGLEKPFQIEEEIIIPSLEDCFTEESMEFVVSELKYSDLDSGSIFNVSRIIEGKYMSLYEKMPGNENKKHFALGPFNQLEIKEESKLRHGCLKWLDEQEPKSVIFISFGTTTSLSEEQIEELANGMEHSQVKFIWVLRDADRGDFNLENDVEVRKVELPKGFEERVKERGLIVRDWAPQLEILGHFATGGFMTHCGWNSCMESISMGVPIAAWPMHSDQPRNAVLMTEILKLGVVVKDWANRGEIVRASTVSEAVRRLMTSEVGEEMRRRTVELSGDVRSAVAEGGVTSLELDSFVAHISR